jgi:predicted site-specific integrase-resolvase
MSGIVVDHRDRRARFGVEHREAALAATGRRIPVECGEVVAVGSRVEVGVGVGP